MEMQVNLTKNKHIQKLRILIINRYLYIPLSYIIHIMEDTKKGDEKKMGQEKGNTQERENKDEGLTQEEHAEIAVGDAWMRQDETQRRAKIGDKEYERRMEKLWKEADTTFEERYGICDEGDY